MITRRRREGNRCAVGGDHADGVPQTQQKNQLMDGGSDNHSVNCTDGFNNRSSNIMNMGAIKRNNNLYQGGKNRQSRYFLHTCTLLAATLTMAGAIRHAAFVTRAGHGSLMKPSSLVTKQQTLCHPRSLACWNSISNSRRSNAASSLWMASSEIETQSSEVEDDADWRTTLSAFQMYKAAYGDLKVPSRFVVPGMAPWPGEKYFYVQTFVLWGTCVGIELGI